MGVDTNFYLIPKGVDRIDLRQLDEAIRAAFPGDEYLEDIHSVEPYFDAVDVIEINTLRRWYNGGERGSRTWNLSLGDWLYQHYGTTYIVKYGNDSTELRGALDWDIAKKTIL